VTVTTGRDRGTLAQAILRALGGRTLTYREIAAAINGSRGYVPADGLYLAVAQVRECVRRRSDVFQIDRNSIPHRVSTAVAVTASGASPRKSEGTGSPVANRRQMAEVL
jgi:hypothetical protein